MNKTQLLEALNFLRIDSPQSEYGEAFNDGIDRAIAIAQQLDEPDDDRPMGDFERRLMDAAEKAEGDTITVSLHSDS